jgi:sulfoxide reductase catalytic subunit YedY
MVIPWDGYPLAELIKFINPLPSAKFVQFISKQDSSVMELPEGIEFPYSEGLRMDEAMNPLTLLTFGSYGEVLANQQGAPIRVIVPWKYGFKSAKSIVRIKFTDKMPRRRGTTWRR